MAKDKVKETKLTVLRVKEQWELDLEEKARKQRAAETLGVPRVTYSSGVLQIDGKKIEGNRLSIVPLGLAYTKEYYEEAYTQGSSATPGCYAFGQDSDTGMIPHEKAPNKQAPQCDGCQHNAFNTAERGRGKRCGDKRRILFLLASDLAAARDAKTPEEYEKVVNKAQSYQITIPPGSLRSFGQYLSSLAESTPHGSIQEAVTEVSINPIPGKAFEVVCTFRDVVPVAAMPALLKRGAPAFSLLSQPFPVIEQAEAPKAVKGQGGRPVPRR